MSESLWSFNRWRNEGRIEGRIEGRVEGRAETAREMFIDGESMIKIKKYSKLSDKDLADVLVSLPEKIQSRYNLN